MIPDGLLNLAHTLPLDDHDIAGLLTAAAISLDPRFKRFSGVLNDGASARGPTVRPNFGWPAGPASIPSPKLDIPVGGAKLENARLIWVKAKETPLTPCVTLTPS
jgi:hypothetical protein